MPRISVVTACRNGGALVSETIASVVQQRYPNCEYLFIDGASTDQTLAVAREFEGKGIDRLVSEPDSGQYHAIQKGLTFATGDVMAWLNGDDVYYPWTLSVVGEVFAKYPGVDWIIGTPSYMNAAGQCTRVSGVAGSAYPRGYVRNGWFRATLAGYLQQESMFWRRSLWNKAGGLDLTLDLAADFDLWVRFAQHAELHAVSAPLALFRQRPGQRSDLGRDKYESEVARVCASLEPPPAWWRWMSAHGDVGRHLARMLIWRKAPVIAYSQAAQGWELSRLLRPLARTTLADLQLERALRSGSPR